jgi:ABC-type transport system involved in multi-copper enzyme maturation permease subunit
MGMFVGMQAGIILAGVMVVYMLIRGKQLVSEFKRLDASFTRLSNKTLFLLFMGMFILMSLIFGALAGMIFSLLDSQSMFMLIAFGLGLLFSLAAVTSKTPLMIDKVSWNLMVGFVLGITVPLLAGG